MEEEEEKEKEEIITTPTTSQCRRKVDDPTRQATPSFPSCADALSNHRQPLLQQLPPPLHGQRHRPTT